MDATKTTFKAGFEKLNKDIERFPHVFPITEVSAKYVSPGRFDDMLVIVTKPASLTRVKMAFDYEIRREADDGLLVTGHTQNVFTNRATGKITRLPEKYYDKLKAALAE